MKKNIVITIERMNGSGGKTVGEMLAKDLGIHYYDRELRMLCAEMSGINEDLFIDADENIKSTKAFKLSRKKGVWRGGLISPREKDFVSTENLFNYQAAVIKKLAETEPCVIVGRCGNYVLRDYENVTSVFVHAPMPFLMEQLERIQPRRGAELEKYIVSTNRYRAEYYEYYTGHAWESAFDYDLSLDASKLGFDKCVEEIKSYLKIRYGEDCLT